MSIVPIPASSAPNLGQRRGFVAIDAVKIIAAAIVIAKTLVA